MQAAGLTIKTEPYTLNVPRSQRGGEIVEPMISTQWFVTIQAAGRGRPGGRARRAASASCPTHFEKVYFNWLENISDWCISRQLWWGHRIPVWYCPDGHMFCARTRGDAYAAACANCGDDVTLEQDPDVLDTWFSSGLWPFSTLGWPDRHARPALLLPDHGAGNRLRHPVLLGGAHDHDGAGVHRPGAVPHRLSARHWCATAGPQDEQDAGQRHRPARGDGRVRHRRPALHPADRPARPATT